MASGRSIKEVAASSLLSDGAEDPPCHKRHVTHNLEFTAQEGTEMLLAIYITGIYTPAADPSSGAPGEALWVLTQGCHHRDTRERSPLTPLMVYIPPHWTGPPISPHLCHTGGTGPRTQRGEKGCTGKVESRKMNVQRVKGAREQFFGASLPS